MILLGESTKIQNVLPLFRFKQGGGGWDQSVHSLKKDQQEYLVRLSP